MVMTLERDAVETRRTGRARSGGPEAGRAVLDALMSRKPATFTIETASSHGVTAFASPLRQLLLMTGRVSGGVSVTVSPHFSEETYPALLDLVSRLDGSGASELWRPDGARTVAVGDARHLFISADMPVAERSMKPDRLIELVSAHGISAEWYRTRVAPRLSGKSVVRVFYGRPGVEGSAFEVANAEAMAEEAMSGELRRFSLVEVVE